MQAMHGMLIDSMDLKRTVGKMDESKYLWSEKRNGYINRYYVLAD
jgi:hypothetical protein